MPEGVGVESLESITATVVRGVRFVGAVVIGGVWEGGVQRGGGGKV